MRVIYINGCHRCDYSRNNHCTAPGRELAYSDVSAAIADKRIDRLCPLHVAVTGPKQSQPAPAWKKWVLASWDGDVKIARMIPQFGPFRAVAWEIQNTGEHTIAMPDW